MHERDIEVENKDDVGEYEKTDGQPDSQCSNVYFTIAIFILISICYFFLCHSSQLKDVNVHYFYAKMFTARDLLVDKYPMSVGRNVVWWGK